VGKKCGLISLDQENAFDRVDHQFLWYTFDTFGFPPAFTALIKVLYENIESVCQPQSM